MAKRKISRLDVSRNILGNTMFPVIQGTPFQNKIISIDTLSEYLRSNLEKIYQTESAPTSPNYNDIWIDSISGIWYIWQNAWISFDSNNEQFVKNAWFFGGNARTSSINNVSGGNSSLDNRSNFIFVDGGTA
jgi:hypothetical protein